MRQYDAEVYSGQYSEDGYGYHQFEFNKTTDHFSTNRQSLIQYAVLYSTLAQKISECISMTLEILKNLKKSKQYTLYQGNGLLLVCIVAPAN
jgi:hypothetical protein